VLLLLTLLAAAIVIGIATRSTAERHQRAGERAERAITNSGLYEEAISAAYDEWVSVTAYFVLQDEAYAERFQHSRATFEISLLQLRDDAIAHNEPQVAQQLDDHVLMHAQFAGAEQRVLDALAAQDLGGALDIALSESLTLNSQRLLTQLQDEVDAQRIELRAAQAQQRAAEQATRRWSLGIGAMCLVMLGVLGFAGYQWIGRALLRTSAATREIAAGNLAAHADRLGPRELADLADDVNSMAEALIRRSDELNAYLSKDLEARTVELERANADLGRANAELARTLEKQRELEDQLRHQAFHDPLTSLANRARFMDRVEHAMRRADRDARHVAVLFMDIDDFKSVNDSLGHPAGDALLVEVAARLQRALRAGDTAARLGGDEFAILLEEVAGPREGAEAAERILAELGKPVQIEMRDVFVRASLGIAIGAAGDTPHEIVRRADVAMYVAKANGKNRYVAYHPGMEASIAGRLELTGELQRAVERNEFVLHYQPSVTLHDGRIIGVEALLRWDHPERGLLAPDEFIPLAEDTGLILPVGRWVLNEACARAREWQLAYPTEPPLSISINVSARQILQTGLFEVVSEALRASGLPPASLILEITESLMLQDAALAMERLSELKRLGLRLAIDDFGTGYSSLSYLRRFPVDILKIDKSFVDGIRTEGKDQELAQSIIELGQTMNLEIVAEGVEHPEQLGWLRARKCDVGQGFLFSRPVPAEAIAALLAARDATAA